MAAISTIALLAAGTLGLLGNVAQGKAEESQANFVASVNEQQAQTERKISAQEERDFRKNTSATLAERRAALGASGVDISSGSPLSAASDFAAEAELQALRIRSGGETKATRLEQQATFNRAAGKAAKRRSYLRGGASLLSGFGQAFS